MADIKLISPVTEMKYLNAENVDRYRVIMRLFYENSEKLKYMMYTQEVFEELKKDSYFADYTMDQCSHDLETLTLWGNLEALQDTRKVSTIEEFRNRKFRYQMTQQSVEIERLLITLEGLNLKGGSLEPSLLERIRSSLSEAENKANASEEEVYSWWKDLIKDFTALNEDYHDYIRELNSIRAEDLMKTGEFLLFKDRFIEYLRNFIRGLQKNAGAIGELLISLKKESKEKIIDKVTTYELSIPRLNRNLTEEAVRENTEGIYWNLYYWFVRKGDRPCEAEKLFDATNEIIRRITRYATRISERSSGAGRKDEYKKAAELFLKTEDISEAHCLSAKIFGIEETIHLGGEFDRSTDSMNESVYDEEGLCIYLKPRVRTYREKMNRSYIPDNSVEKAKKKREMREKAKERKKALEALEKDGAIVFSELPIIDSEMRNQLLTWISRAMDDQERIGITDEGRRFRLTPKYPEKKCTVECVDGNFTMPAFTIEFEER